MAFAFIENGAITDYPVYRPDIQSRFRNVSFPTDLESCDLSDFGVVTVVEVETPAFDQDTQTVEEVAPTLVDGVWKQTWSVTQLDEAALQQIQDDLAASVRSDRNGRLKVCDWTVLPDSPLSTDKKTEWETYRTALRNITAAEGFPNSISWPTEPS